MQQLYLYDSFAGVPVGALGAASNLQCSPEEAVEQDGGKAHKASKGDVEQNGQYARQDLATNAG